MSNLLWVEMLEAVIDSKHRLRYIYYESGALVRSHLYTLNRQTESRWNFSNIYSHKSCESSDCSVLVCSLCPAPCYWGLHQINRSEQVKLSNNITGSSHPARQCQSSDNYSMEKLGELHRGQGRMEEEGMGVERRRWDHQVQVQPYP